jgi:hypothetical protein
MRVLLMALGLAASVGLAVNCGRAKKKSDPPEATPETEASPNPETANGSKPISYLFNKLEDFPTCNDDYEGALGYNKADSKFYNCSGGQWQETSIASQSSGGASVYDGAGSKLGALIGATNSYYGILFANGGYANFNRTGTFNGPVCPNSSCTLTTGDPASYSCAFTTSNCTGTCYTSFQPLKNTLFFAGGTTFHKAEGTETASTQTIASAWKTDSSSCIVTGGAISVYSLSSYSFPTGISYPFTTGLYVAP